MKESSYYYGVEIKPFKDLTYEEVLYKKILLGKKLLRKLVINKNMEDYRRINDVQKAIKFNEKLLFELGYDLGTISKKLNELSKEERANA
ncbi:hypothetical protein PT520_09610 [Aliarcobacter butzleri]|uniref:Uncharacterized protein n=1 Tax=Aliarcobacter butzleri TaxID=28197 RepID=A0AAW6VQC2_9BACT|nr:hypothetical protein [Aliarcobacter butzleri]MDK2062772.1 hypothetical protein [Aliarcobacter butzleri]